jgi:hypothetical protein
MQPKARITSTGQIVYILDDLFAPHEHLLFLRNAEAQQYRFITPGTGVQEHRKDGNFGKMFDPWDDEIIGITQSPNFPTILQLTGDRRAPTRCWVNALHIHAESYFHPDGFADNDLTFLYYMNSEWGLNWGGETLLCDTSGEPDLVVRAVPNRGVLFPSRLLHRIASPSRHASPWRYTFVMQFSPVNKKETTDERPLEDHP